MHWSVRIYSYMHWIHGFPISVHSTIGHWNCVLYACSSYCKKTFRHDLILSHKYITIPYMVYLSQMCIQDQIVYIVYSHPIISVISYMTKAAVFIPPSGTLSTFSCPLCLILSSCVSTVAVLVFPYILFRTYHPFSFSFLCAYPLLSPPSCLSATSLVMLSQLHSFHWHVMQTRS